MAKNKNKTEKELSDLKHCNEIKEIAEAALSAKKVIADAASEATKVIANSTTSATLNCNNNAKRDYKEQTGFQKFLYNQVSLTVAIVGLAFGIYFTFANPQKQTDLVLAGVQQQFAVHEAVQNKTESDLYDKLNLIQNGDLKDLQTNIMDEKNQIISLQNETVKLETIIDERLPAAKK